MFRWVLPRKAHGLLRTKLRPLGHRGRADARRHPDLLVAELLDDPGTLHEPIGVRVLAKHVILFERAVGVVQSPGLQGGVTDIATLASIQYLGALRVDLLRPGTVRLGYDPEIQIR